MNPAEAWPRARARRQVRQVLERAGLEADLLAHSVIVRPADKYNGEPGRYVWVWPSRQAERGYLPKLTREQTEIAAAALSAHFPIVATFPTQALVCVRIPTPETR